MFSSYSLLLVWVVEDDAFAMDMLSDVVQLTLSESDHESLYRCAVCIGQLVFKYATLREALKLMDVAGLRKKMTTGDDRLRYLATEIERYLQ